MSAFTLLEHSDTVPAGLETLASAGRPDALEGNFQVELGRWQPWST